MIPEPDEFLIEACRLGYLSDDDIEPIRDALGRSPGEALVARGLLTGDQAEAVHQSLSGRDSVLQTLGLADGVEVDLKRTRAIEIPDRGPRFVRDRKLGHGGMGEVHLAIDRDLRREVAIKTLRQPDKETAVRRFLEEAQVTGQLEHPNIVPVHELGVEQGGARPYLVMRRIRGRSLSEVLNALESGQGTGLGVGPESPAKAFDRLLGIFLKVADALAYAHSRGVIHRDVKPENIMVGEYGEVHVMDWGLAKVLGRPDASPLEPTGGARIESPRRPGEETNTMAGQLLGTPMYMSPEQARGEVDSLDERTDVYGLGALLYRILALVDPVDGSQIESILHKIRGGDIDRPSTRSRAPWPIPRELEAVVGKAMALDPAERYRSVVDLQEEIESFRAGRTLRAASYTPWARVGKWLRRNRTTVVWILATLVVALGGFFSTAFTARDLSDQALVQSSHRVEREVRSLLDSARSVALANVRHLESRRPSSAAELDRLGRGYFEQIAFYDAFTYILVGFEDGSTTSAVRGPGGRIEYDVLVRDASGRASGGHYARGDDGRIERVGDHYRDREGGPYDPRVRPWYQAAREAGRPIWTDSYVFINSPPEDPETVGISFAVPLAGDGGAFAGAGTVDFDFYSICEFLQELSIGDRGMAFVVEVPRSGSRRVVAHPEPERLWRVVHDGPTERHEIVPMEELDDPRIAAFLDVLPPADEFAPGVTTFEFAAGGEDHLGSFHALDGLAGERYPRWIVCVAVPEGDFTSRVDRMGLATLVVVGVALAVGFFAYRWDRRADRDLI